jgi:hypothetical protein
MAAYLTTFHRDHRGVRTPTLSFEIPAIRIYSPPLNDESTWFFVNLLIYCKSEKDRFKPLFYTLLHFSPVKIEFRVDCAILFLNLSNLCG